MSRVSINKSGDWHVEHDRQDIRGWGVKNTAGEDLGRVRDLIADTETELIDTIVLDDGEEYPASDVELDENERIVYVEGVAAEEGAVVEPVPYQDVRVGERGEGAVAGFAAHEPRFREHYREKYGAEEREYGHYHPAYRLGYDYAIDDAHRGQDWSSVSDQARRNYEARHGEGTWDQVKDAARHAFERARSTSGRARGDT